MGNTTRDTKKKSRWTAVKAQFRRIIWPTKEALVRESAAVVAVSVVLGVVIAALDRILLLFADLIISL